MSSLSFSCQRAMVRHRILIIGGDPRQLCLQRLKRDLPDALFEWCPTIERDASDRRFRHRILNGSFDLVVALYGLMRHQHASAIRHLCAAAGTRLVNLYRSPSPVRLRAALGDL